MVLKSVPKPPQTVHDKKRQGLHHKPTRHYTKTYWPYLPMLLVLAIGVLVNMSWGAGKAVLGYATSVSPTSLLQETNIQRGQHSQTALVLNNQLAAAAQAKANDMAARDYWAHVAPDGTQPWQFIAKAGYGYAAAAENLAYGFDSSSATVAGWMNSSGHRANILNSTYRDVGFGIANVANYQGGGEQTIIVAMYGQPQPATAPNTVRNGTAPITARVAGPTEPTPATPTPSATSAADPEPTPIASTQQPPTPTEPASPGQTLQAKEVARVDILTNGDARWAAILVAFVAGLSIIIFFIKHARLWQKLLVRGESFIIHHPVLDTAFVLAGVAGFLLTRTTGFIY